METKSNYTPVIQQYLEIKAQYKDCILFFRMGDFYELFFEDAKISAPIMDVVLTRRQNNIPMCGVPYHSAEIYINRLLQAGKRIAIAEQISDSPNAKIMQRKVVRVLTPATIIEENLLKDSDSCYLMSLHFLDTKIGISLADISTGQVIGYELSTNSKYNLQDLYFSYVPKEIILIQESEKLLKEHLKSNCFLYFLETWKASQDEAKRKIENFYKIRLESILQKEKITSPLLGSLSLLIYYLEKNFPDQKIDLELPKFYWDKEEFLVLDEKTIKNLNLFEPREISLYSLFSPITSKGKRLLRDFLLHPLKDILEIQKRLELVESLIQKPNLITSLREDLKEVGDLERILTRMQYNKANPKDFRTIIHSVRAIEKIIHSLEIEEIQYKIQVKESLKQIVENLDCSIVEDPPAILGNSQFLKNGIDKEYDEAFFAKQKGSEWILDLEKKERQKTGLSSLKIGYNKITGYYIEISRVQAKNAPKDYERKQTLTNYERFMSLELKEIERKILLSEQILEEIEKKYFEHFVQLVLENKSDLKELIEKISYLDILIDFAKTSLENHWTKPKWNQNKELYLKNSRHPVVEKFIKSKQDFIPNDVYLNTKDQSLAIITGPNMSGKSTYIRQVAIIQILAQIGCFIPAEDSNLSIVDRIFTRVGASDNLAMGESTFFVEMLETAQILNYFTEDSLIIMDEVGRGTSTYDGLSLAWAIVEYLTEEIKPKTLFATHYYELTELEKREGVFNLTVEVLEENQEVVFLHKIKKGTADKSYGIYVAKLAGLPKKVIERSQTLLNLFESKHKQTLLAQMLSKKKKTEKISINLKKQIELF
ncbi:MAG: DNA mismatch repair protein MutS [Leptonema sp. (in: bacteria)]